MKGYIAQIIKDSIIGILVVICITIIMSLVFYDKIALSRVIPEAEEYFLTEEMQDEIEKSDLDETEEVIINYYIDASDLKKYEKTNEYIKGKSNPFAVTSEYTGNINSSSNNATSDSNGTGNGGFFEDDGTK